MVEASIGVVIAAIRKRKLLYIVHFERQIIVVPRSVNNREDSIRFANLDQDQKQSSCFFQNPFDVGVVAQIAEADRLCKAFPLFRL